MRESGCIAPIFHPRCELWLNYRVPSNFQFPTWRSARQQPQQSAAPDGVYIVTYCTAAQPVAKRRHNRRNEWMNRQGAFVLYCVLSRDYKAMSVLDGSWWYLFRVPFLIDLRFFWNSRMGKVIFCVLQYSFILLLKKWGGGDSSDISLVCYRD